MPTIYIENKPYEVKAGQNMLQAVLSLGFDLPYFCWHPALGSVGACRQCAVIQYKDEHDDRGKLQMACMLAAEDGTRISIKALQAVEFRASVIEWLMVNHPHDCPVCDEGGECHLQDMTVMTGHNYREFRFNKRTHRNQDLGPFINHEMNRCIACYRCVRFYRDFAGGDDLDVFSAHDHVYFGRTEDGTLENEFSGNLVEVCPTGVFTDKTLKQHYARKWDLQGAPSICQHCGVGCNTIAGTRYDRVVRTLNRYNRQVNGYFLCDRGRFGYEFVNSPDRIREARMRSDRKGEFVTADEKAAIDRAVDAVHAGKRVVGIGSSRASLESNHALRTLVGEKNFSHGLGSPEGAVLERIIEVLREGPARSLSLNEIERADAVVVLGEDLTNTAPMVALAVRQAVRNKPMQAADKLKIPHWNDHAVRGLLQDETGPLYIASIAATKLDRLSTGALHAAPDDIARFGMAIAHELDNSAPAVDDLAPDTLALARKAATDLKGAERPVVIAGASLGSDAIVRAAANVAWALAKDNERAGIALVAPEVNSVGIGLSGGKNLDEIVTQAEAGEIDTLIVLENDLYRRADASIVDRLLASCRQVFVLDHIETPTTREADLVLPAATFSEATGTVVNSEGRAQRYFAALQPGLVIRESWRWILDIMRRLEREEGDRWKCFDDIARAALLATGVTAVDAAPAPDASYRINGGRVARSPHRFSGRTAMTADRSVHEPQPLIDFDSPLSFSQEGYLGRPPDAALIPFFWSPGWNSVQSTAKYQQEVDGPLRGGDPGVRLVEPARPASRGYYTKTPEAFVPTERQKLIVPLHHIFGSDETSAQGAAVATRLPDPYVGMSADDAASMGISDRSMVRVTLGEVEIELQARLINGLPRGVIGLPMGIPGVAHVRLPVPGEISTEVTA